MNVFARPVRTVPCPHDILVRRLFIAIVVIGAALRGMASFTTLSLINPDEHQQFLEQAFRTIHGYGHVCWEQERGIRHPVYPALLAIPLAIGEAAGVDDPVMLSALIRSIVSLLALAACVLLAWEFHRRGDTSMSLILGALYALLPDIIYAQIHPLSETGATIPFLIALVLMDRWPFASGILLVLSFGIRFQMGFIVGATVITVWGRNHGRIDRAFLLLATGFVLAMLTLGLCDRFMFGNWFHSPIEYFRANLIEGMANNWGRSPWYQYLLWLGQSGWGAIVPIILLFLLGFRREWAIGLLVTAFILPHVLVAHKEARFMLPIAPMMLALVVAGLDEFIFKIVFRFRLGLFIMATTGVIVVSALRVSEIPWQGEPYRSTAHLLGTAGRLPDLKGIVVFHQSGDECPNYFFLRRQVPLVATTDVDLTEVKKIIRERDWRINFVICRTNDIHVFLDYGPERVAGYEGLSLYRLACSFSAP